MWPILSGWIQKLQHRMYKYSIKRALALHHRNEVRSDGLALDNVCSRLDICWYARDVHPWDSALPPEKRAQAFNQQAMEDTEAAVRRILERRPEVDVIGIRVFEPHSSTLLASGTVERSALNGAGLRSPSVRMRLGELGIRYFFMNMDEASCHTEPRSDPSSDLDQRRIA